LDVWGLNPSELACRLASLTDDDWLRVIGSLEEPLIDRISALIEPIDREPEQGVGPAVDELIEVGDEINRGILDSEKYRRIPEPIRGFFETHGYETLTLGVRLLESANARLQVEEIRRKLRDLSVREECSECNLMDAIEAIEKVLSSSYLDVSP